MDQFDSDIDNLPTEDLIHIDIDAINEDSKKEASDMIRVVTDLFYDEKFKEQHPQAQRRIEMEIETLRGLIKMRKADEEAHDALLQAIAENKSNASLYRSMAEIQKTSIALSNKIHDTIDRLNNICKEFTIDMPVEETEQSSEDTEQKNGAHRGSKSFIESMLAKH